MRVCKLVYTLADTGAVIDMFADYPGNNEKSRSTPGDKNQLRFETVASCWFEVSSLQAVRISLISPSFGECTYRCQGNRGNRSTASYLQQYPIRPLVYTARST